MADDSREDGHMEAIEEMKDRRKWYGDAADYWKVRDRISDL